VLTERLRPILLLAALTACGGSSGPDYAAAFVGTWTGNASVTSNGSTQTSNGVSLRISSTGTNALQLADICEDLSGPAATATSATTFTIGSRNCPPAPVTGCSAVTLAITSGNGVVSGNSLTLTLSATVTGCSLSFPAALVFTGTKSGASSSAPGTSIFSPR